MPQGSIMGPLLFIIFINDLVNSAPSVNSILFADDTTVFSTDFHTLKTELKQIEEWCLANKLILNSQKTLLIHFKNPQKPLLDSLGSFYINKIPISIQNFTQFLGITLDENISFNNHIMKLTNKLQCVLLMMRHVRRYFDIKTMIDLYYTFFYPHLIYGIEFWGHTSSRELDKILLLQKKAVRIILKIKPKAPVFNSFTSIKIMPIKMLFEFRLVLHFINVFKDADFQNMSIDHNYCTRLKASNAIKTQYFKTKKGQRSMLYTAAKLFNKYLFDFQNMASSVRKIKLAERLWAGGGSGAAGAHPSG